MAVKNVSGNRLCTYFVVKQSVHAFCNDLDQHRFSSYGVPCPLSTLDRLATVTSYATRKPPEHAIGLRIRGLKDNAIQQPRPS